MKIDRVPLPENMKDSYVFSDMLKAGWSIKPVMLSDYLKLRIEDSADNISNRYEELKKNNPELSLDDILKLLNNDNERTV